MDWRDDPDFGNDELRMTDDGRLGDKAKVQLELCRKFYEKCKEFGTDGSDEMRQAMSMIGDWKAEIKLGGLGWPVANRERFAAAMAGCGVGMGLEKLAVGSQEVSSPEGDGLAGPRLRAVVCDVMVRFEEWSLAYKAAVARLREWEARGNDELRGTNDEALPTGDGSAVAPLPEVRVMKARGNDECRVTNNEARNDER